MKKKAIHTDRGMEIFHELDAIIADMTGSAANLRSELLRALAEAIAFTEEGFKGKKMNHPRFRFHEKEE